MMNLLFLLLPPSLLRSQGEPAEVSQTLLPPEILFGLSIRCKLATELGGGAKEKNYQDIRDCLHLFQEPLPTSAQTEEKSNDDNEKNDSF